MIIAQHLERESQPVQSPLKKIKTIHFPSSVFGVDYWPQKDFLFANCMDGVYQLNLESEERKNLGSHSSYGSMARVLPDHGKLITSGYDGAIRWFDLESGAETRVVQAHKFWSWDMDISPDQKVLATVSGQYLAGGYRYEPKSADESTVKILDAESGETRFEWKHLPPVQAVTISPDNRFVAAGNLMGEVRVWNLLDGKQVAEFKTDDLTSWGIIKSHCYIGGIYAMSFDQSGEQILVAGMGPMRDPMAGNGKQRWQAFRWKENPALIRASKDDQCGEGLMETLARHPKSGQLVMAGRLRGGKWNVGLFDTDKAELLHSENTSDRVTDARFEADGTKLFLAATKNQPNPRKQQEAKRGFGRVHVFEVQA